MRKEFPVLHTYNKINEKIIKTIYNISTIYKKEEEQRREDEAVTAKSNSEARREV